MKRHDAMYMRFQKAIAKADWPEALDAVDGLIKEQPNGVSLHYNRGLVLKLLDRLPDANGDIAHLLDRFEAAGQIVHRHHQIRPVVSDGRHSQTERDDRRRE